MILIFDFKKKWLYFLKEYIIINNLIFFMYKKIKAFTLVELIISVSVLAILSAIWFISYSWYLMWVRDVSRISELTSLSEWLKLYSLKSNMPLPDDYIEIKDGWEVIAYQWYIWKNILDSIDYSNKWIDPLYKTYYSYYLTFNRNHFQLMAILEEEYDSHVVSFLSNKVFATDYSDWFPYVYWKKLWILTNENNTPIQEIESIKTAGEIDVSTSDITFKSFLRTDEFVQWQLPDELKKLHWIADDKWKSWNVENNSFVKATLPEWWSEWWGGGWLTACVFWTSTFWNCIF